MSKARVFDGYKKTGTDQSIEDAIEHHCDQFGISSGEAVKLFPILSRRQTLKRFLAHHEFFLKTLNVPGDIAELGVFRGLGLMTWANFLEIHCIGDRTKIVWGFDNWQGFKSLSSADGEESVQAHKTVGGFSPEGFQEELLNAVQIFDRDRFIPYKARIKFIDGDLETTAQTFVEENPGVRFSLIHFDCDLYQPTKAALEAFWPKLSRGGIMLFDEYSIHDWPGETQAVDEFFSQIADIQVKTLPWTNAPAGYVIKG